MEAAGSVDRCTCKSGREPSNSTQYFGTDSRNVKQRTAYHFRKKSGVELNLFSFRYHFFLQVKQDISKGK